MSPVARSGFVDTQDPSHAAGVRDETPVIVGIGKGLTGHDVFEGRYVKGLPRVAPTCGYAAVQDGEMRMEEVRGMVVMRAANGPVTRAPCPWKGRIAPRPPGRTGVPPGGV